MSSNLKFSMKQTLEMQTAPRVQLLTNLISCDDDHDDDLSFCLITLAADNLKTILDTHREWQKAFPDSLEITLEDREQWAQFLTDDEEEKLDAAMPSRQDDAFRLITKPEEFLDYTEADNSREAWSLGRRKIVIREESVRFVGVYEYNPLLRNAFTASPLIPLNTFREALKAIEQGEEK